MLCAKNCLFLRTNIIKSDHSDFACSVKQKKICYFLRFFSFEKVYFSFNLNREEIFFFTSLRNDQLRNDDVKVRFDGGTCRLWPDPCCRGDSRTTFRRGRGGGSTSFETLVITELLNLRGQCHKRYFQNSNYLCIILAS